MAGDYLQIDDDLPEKPETQRICDLTNTPVETVVGRLVLLWRWVDRHAHGEIITGATAKTLARVATGDEGFWESVASLGDWLEIHPDGLKIPGWDKRFSESAKIRARGAWRQRKHRANGQVTDMSQNAVTIASPREEKRRSVKKVSEPAEGKRSVEANASQAAAGLKIFDPERVRDEAQRLAAALGISSHDDFDFGHRIAALIVLGKLAGPMVADCAAETKNIATGNPMGLFRTKLRAACKRKRIDLEAMVKAVKFPADYDRVRPEPIPEIAELAEALSRKDSP